MCVARFAEKQQRTRSPDYEIRTRAVQRLGFINERFAMSVHAISWLIVLIAVGAANLPWLTERFFFFLSPPGAQGKRPWMRLLEWFVLMFVVGLIAVGLEKKTTGVIFHQGWEFYTVGVCLFIVFALPGFIYRHDLRKHLDRR